uniref:N(6)-L-threonylcarbamoyladenine synthase n=1 Tax=Syphacia muris TaxID=451379 RepID=A0A0N5AZP1_9BILA
MRNVLSHFQSVFPFAARNQIFSFFQFFSTVAECRPVLGIETSCDDTAVSIVADRILASNRFSDSHVLSRLGGICPSVVALQHRDLLPVYVKDCLNKSGLRLSDLGGIAVTTRPGLVIALKAGIIQAIALARKGHLPLVGVHHMQAHATMATFCDRSIHFPFIAFLVSGGHTLISVAYSPTDFELYGKNLTGSCGECIDKIVRDIQLVTGTYKDGICGSVLERIASQCSKEERLKYRIRMPRSCGANFDFTWIKQHYQSLLKKVYNQQDFNVPAFCGSVEHCLAGYLASRLHNCLEYFRNSGKINEMCKKIVFCGGVASNLYIRKVLQLICSEYNMKVFSPPPKFCTDNGEMIGWNGLLILKSGGRHPHVYAYDALPVFLPAEARCLIGNDLTNDIPLVATRKLSVKHLADSRIVFR